MVEIKGFNEAYNNMLEIEAMKKIKKQALKSRMWIITTAARLPGRKVRQQRPAPAKQCRGNANDADNNISITERLKRWIT